MTQERRWLGNLRVLMEWRDVPRDWGTEGCDDRVEDGGNRDSQDERLAQVLRRPLDTKEV